MGQLTIESLFAFLPTLALTGLLAASLVAQISELDGRREEYLRISKSESVARALEVLCYSGIDSMLDFSDGSVRYHIEMGSLHSDHLGKVVETRGVFAIDRSEPV
ncbi:MAG: hypothetical protein V1861_00770 [Candidatus Micrarchaeota archaeon]